MSILLYIALDLMKRNADFPEILRTNGWRRGIEEAMNTVDATCGSRRAIYKPTWLSFAVRAMRNERLILIWLRPPDMGELDHNLAFTAPSDHVQPAPLTDATDDKSIAVCRPPFQGAASASFNTQLQACSLRRVTEGTRRRRYRRSETPVNR